MFIKNKKIYLICLLISWVGSLLYFVGIELFDSDIWFIALLIATIAGAICGSLSIFWSLIKAACKRRASLVLSLPFFIIYLFLKGILILWAIGLGLLCCVVFPGVFATIAWFKNKDYLVE